MAGGGRGRLVSLPCSYYLGATHKNVVCQDSSAGFCKNFSPSPSKSDSQWLIPTNSHDPVSETGVGTSKKLPTKPSYLDAHPGLCFHSGGSIPQGRPLVRCCPGLREGQCSECVAAPLIPLMQSVLVSLVLRDAHLHPLVPGFLQWCLIHG